MGFDDFFEHGHKHHKHGYEHHHDHDGYYQPSHSNNQHYDLKYHFLNKLQNDPQFRVVILIAVVVLLVILIITAILLIPLIIKLFQFMSQNGIQGLIDIIWKGTK
jgi:hypothetical protein